MIVKRKKKHYTLQTLVFFGDFLKKAGIFFFLVSIFKHFDSAFGIHITEIK